uniref:protein-L-isoaspartate(D-aspartate) O-methyltransferase n=1 Tax=Cacopsylla melanoneura TaxID=428564 RepID=A0A8D9EK72_9HEMI
MWHQNDNSKQKQKNVCMENMPAVKVQLLAYTVKLVCLLNYQISPVSASSRSYEEYEVDRSLYTTAGRKQDSFSEEESPYKKYRRQQLERYENKDEEHRRYRGGYYYNKGDENRQGRDSRHNYRKPIRPKFDQRDKNSREYSKYDSRERKSREYSRENWRGKNYREYSRESLRDKHSQEYSKHDSRDRKSRETVRQTKQPKKFLKNSLEALFSDSRALNYIEDETFERYKEEMQRKLDEQWERDKKEMIQQTSEKYKDNNFIERNMFGFNKEYLRPYQGQLETTPERRRGFGPLEKKFNQQYRQRKPSDINHDSMKELVFDLYSQGAIQSSKIYDTMLKIDRAHYLMKTNDGYYPYKDQIQYLPMGVIINAPYEHARILELLKDHLKSGARVLDIGSGSGYLTACFAHLAGEEGQVTAVELIPEVLQFTQYNIGQGNPELLPNIKFQISDGRASFGDHGPYDVIHVGAAYTKYPEIFIHHLKPGGRLVIPVGEHRQQLLTIFDKFENRTIGETPVGLVQMQHLKSISQQLRLMDVPKAKPMSVALKYYVEKWLNDRDADLSEIISTTESIKRLRGDKNKKNKKPRKFYNLAFDQRKHKMDEVLD